MVALLVATALASTPIPAWDHDYTELDAFLDGAVDARGVDYRTLATRRDRLDRWITAAATAPVGSFDADQALAFWINAYDALTLQVVLSAGPISSIMELEGGKLWTTRRFRVGGEELTLDALENTKIRARGDARVHAAVNCAARGCSPLPPDPVRPATLSADLDAAARRWVATNAFVATDTDLRLSKIFEWYAADFPADPAVDLPGVDPVQEGAVQFAIRHASPDVATKLRSGAYRVSYGEYDWALNQR